MERICEKIGRMSVAHVTATNHSDLKSIVSNDWQIGILTLQLYTTFQLSS
jgi:hypothetical protein